MDQKKAYELTVSSKLEALPLPDMADAIWARIEAGLDIDLPAGDGGGGNPGSPPGAGWLGRVGLFVFLTAFVTLFLIYKNNKKPATFLEPNRSTAPVQSPLPPDKINNTGLTIKQGSTPLPQDRSAAPPVNNAVVSSLAMPAAVVPLPDSAQQATIIPLPSLPVGDTMQQKRKIRGVPGITDNDYRIVPAKKDSS